MSDSFWVAQDHPQQNRGKQDNRAALLEHWYLPVCKIHSDTTLSLASFQSHFETFNTQIPVVMSRHTLASCYSLARGLLKFKSRVLNIKT